MNTTSDAATAAVSQSSVSPQLPPLRQHLLEFGDNCVAVKFDEQDHPDVLSLHALELTRHAMGAISALYALNSHMAPEELGYAEHVASITAVVQFTLAAAYGLQFDARETLLAERGAA